MRRNSSSQTIDRKKKPRRSRDGAGYRETVSRHVALCRSEAVSPGHHRQDASPNPATSRTGREPALRPLSP